MKKIPWGWVIVVLILIYVGALTLPYVAHKKVSSTFVKENGVLPMTRQEPSGYPI